MEINQVRDSYRCFEEIINKKKCPQCQNPLKYRWLTQEEQEKLTFDVPDPKFRNGSELSQIEIYFCSNCAWQHPSLICKDKFVDIPLAEEKKYQKERNLVEKIVAVLLPNQPIKIRFIKNNKSQQTATNLLNHPQRGKSVYCICFSIEHLVQAEKTWPGIFCDVLVHELAHASPEVFKNPQHNSNEHHLNCSCGLSYHPGEGHDKIWHDKYDEFRERIKNENLAADSEYIAMGKEFTQKRRQSEEEKSKNSTDNAWKKPGTYVVLGLIISSLVFVIYYLVSKKKVTKNPKSL
ncbi:hypothetical protein [endosymbiont GvMRE of Glomus versiforme]|uniref:hypothetical protein n=1 Tax=endosymbiont GvMRE of Glomus versiforme TaxID=2039283 RepID=UPI000ED0BDAA|nr:hypothetical protein [endosymbiont GvMRE of Glomus versiforme]RHZ36363.1 hypothetical protein GvMRE_Ic1g163 [endosymbiont GvMRE of Glomus versiforme]